MNNANHVHPKQSLFSSAKKMDRFNHTNEKEQTILWALYRVHMELLGFEKENEVDSEE